MSPDRFDTHTGAMISSSTQPKFGGMGSTNSPSRSLGVILGKLTPTSTFLFPSLYIVPMENIPPYKITVDSHIY